MPRGSSLRTFPIARLVNGEDKIKRLVRRGVIDEGLTSTKLEVWSRLPGYRCCDTVPRMSRILLQLPYCTVEYQTYRGVPKLSSEDRLWPD